MTRASAEDGDVDTEKCIQCMECINVCPTSAINVSYRFDIGFKEYLTVQETSWVLSVSKFNIFSFLIFILPLHGIYWICARKLEKDIKTVSHSCNN